MRALLIISTISISVFALSFVSQTAVNPSQIPTDSLAADRLKYMNQVLESIKGKEDWRADSVFKNLKVITGNITAKHFLLMMNYGWSTELGVSCSYCHVVGKWESDSLETKNIARGMWNMRQQINGEILPKITGKDYWKNPKVTCITCHRGKPKPEVD